MTELTQARLRELLAYDPETGEFRWRVRTGSRSPVGVVAGCTNPEGYRQIRVCGGLHRAHRLAFLYMTGAWPEAMVDHVDGDRANNRWTNLREATNGQNKHNAGTQRNSVTGFKNVSRPTARASYEVRIKARGKLHWAGGFATPELAAEFAGLMRETLHGQFARHA